MASLYIRQPGQDPFQMEKNEVVPAIKSGMLSAGDEISVDGNNWISLGTHKQLGTLFKDNTATSANTAEATASPPPAPKRRKMTVREFYDNDRVFCPKCGFEQDRGSTCEKCEIIFEKYWEKRMSGGKPAVEPAEQSRVKSGSSGNFLSTLWNGEYPLWVTFWIFGVAVPFGIWFLLQTFIFTPGMQSIMTQNPSQDELMEAMRSSFRSIMIVSMVMTCYQFIVSVGLWRAARVYEGFGLWRVLVQIIVVLFFISIPFTIFSFISGWGTMEQGLQQMDTLMQMQQNQMQQNSPGQP